MTFQSSQPTSLVYPILTLHPPDVDQVALASERDDGEESNWIERPSEGEESSFLLRRWRFGDLEDDLVRLVFS